MSEPKEKMIFKIEYKKLLCKKLNEYKQADLFLLLSVIAVFGIILSISVSAQPVFDNLSLPGSSLVGEPTNLPPRIESLTPDKPSGQGVAEDAITWTAKATDPEPEDQLLYLFRLIGPSTGNIWKNVTSWEDNSWVWQTSKDDAGQYQIQVWVRDGKHAGRNGYDAETTVGYELSAPEKKVSQAPQQIVPEQTPSQPSVPTQPTVVPQAENKPPKLTDLSSDKPKPQAGQVVIWTARATDPEPTDQLLYEFWLTGPSTNGQMVDKTGWTSDNTWTWATTSDDVGNNQVEVWVRDGNNAGENSFDARLSKMFTVNPAPSEVPIKVPPGIPAPGPKVPTPLTPTPGPIVTDMPPVLSAFGPDKSIVEAGSKVISTAVVTDNENDPLVYKFLLKGPATGGQLAEKTGWISDNSWTWTTTPSDVGQNQIEVWVRDNKHAGSDSKDDSADAMIAVNMQNQKPSITGLSPDKSSAEAGSTVIWSVLASDPDNDPLVYKFFLKGPASDGQLVEKTDWVSDNFWTWTTTPADVGQNQIEVRVRDNKHAGTEGFDDNRVITYTVNQPAPKPETKTMPIQSIQSPTNIIPAPSEVNMPPVVKSLVPNETSPQFAGEVIAWTAAAIDPETEDTIFYKFFLKGPNTKNQWTQVTDWGTESTWTWTTSPKDVGTSQVQVWVRDGKNAGPESKDDNLISDTFTINAQKPKTEAQPLLPVSQPVTGPANITPAEDKPPVMSSLAPDKPSRQFAGTLVTWTSAASDPENDPLFFKFFLNGPATGNQWTQQTNWVSENVWRWATSSRDIGRNQIKASVRDNKHAGPEGSAGNATVDYIINATVQAPLPKPAPIEINKPPVVSSLTPDKPSPQIVGTIVTWNAAASDPENDPLLYKFFLSGPSTSDKWAEKTGWVPGNTWAWTTSAKEIGDNQVRVWIRDGKHAGTESSDSNATLNYTINAAAPITLPKPAVNETKPQAVNQTKPAPINVTPVINVTPAKPAQVTINKPPVVSSLTPDKTSPQFAGTVIAWNAAASDTENDPLVFKFFLNGPTTSNQWKEQTQWVSENTWAWTTSTKDVGNNQVRVWVRDGKHAGPESSDTNATVNYTINATAPTLLPKPVPKNETPAKPPAINETKPPAVNQTKPAPANVTPVINVTPAKPALAPTATVDLPPVANSLLSDKLSPQVPETSVTWTANATDPEKDKILYRFFLNGPSTSGSWKPETDWSETSSWTWTTSKSDVGSNQVRVWVRDGKHAKEDGFDGEQVALFTIKEISRNISGLAFEDKEGKPALIGWTVNLIKPDGSEVSTLTGQDGSYKFENLAPGSYTVNEVLKAGWSATSPADGSQKVILASSDINDVKFGNKATTFSISGKEFNDLNNNGVNDGEPGLAGWTINLEQPAGKVIKTATTAADGTYKFENQTPGDYVLTEVVQKGWTQTAPSTKSYSVSLKDTDVTGEDFGNNAGSWSISGTAFQDLNGNKTGLAGWKIQLFQSGNVLNVTDTAADGSYAFRNLAPGTYTLSEVPQNGWVQTLPAGGSYSVTLKDADISGKDFVNKGNLSISGMKYYDLNGNGVQDKDEPGIPGQTVALLDSGREIATITTGQDGSYTFNNLAQGTYTINDPPSGGFVLTTTSSITVTITTSMVINANFGLTGTHSISGAKFNDVNNNGVMDSGEGVAGWGIVLDGTTAFSGIHITRTVNTASDGSYVFNHLCPGTYKISELSRPGWTQTVPSEAGSYTVSLGGSDVVDKNFGNRVVNSPGTASIWGMKFNDLNNNGVNNGDPGLSGWTILLKNATNNTVIRTTTTNAQGWYSFTSLAPGGYIVAELVQPSWTQTLPGSSGVYTLTLASGESKVGIDFGNYNPPPINPTLTPFPSSPQKVGTVVTWTAGATDPNGDLLKFRFILRDTHGGILVDTGYTNNNVWTWYTGSLGGQPGTYQVEVRITDNKHPSSSDARATASYMLTQSNRRPEVNFLYAYPHAPQFAGSWIKWTAVAHDADGDPILYRYFLRGPSTGGFWEDMTGWTRNPNWAWRTSPLDIGSNEILVIVRDGNHAGPNGWDDFAVADYLIVGLNQPPVITSLGTSTPSSPQPAGATIRWAASAVDPNGDPIFYRYWLKGPSTGGFWRIVHDWSTDNTWTWTTSLADAGTSQVDVQVRDGFHAGPNGFDDDAASLFTILPPDLPPQLTGLASDKLSPLPGGLPVRWSATAIDPDGDLTLYRFWLKGPATGNAWKIVQDWSNSNTWIWATSPVDAGDYTVYVYVIDGKHAGPNGYDSAIGKSFTVLPSNRPPQIRGLSPDLPSPQYAGVPIRWTATASDPEPEPIFYRFWLKGPATGNAWKIVQDWSYNNVWVWTDKPSDAGNYSVYVYSRDGWNAGPNGYDSALGRTFSLSNPATIKKLTFGPAPKDRPSLIYTVDGYLMAYQSWDLGPSNNGDIFLQKFDPLWGSMGNLWTTNDTAYQDSPSAISSGGYYYVAYVSNETGNMNVFLKKFDNNLNLVDTKQLTDSPVDQDSPSLIQVGNEFFLAYQSWDTGSDDGGDIFVSRFDQNWNLESRVQVTDLKSYQDHPSIAFDGVNFYIAYVSRETGNLEIFVKRFDENLLYMDTRQITSDTTDQDFPALNYTSGQFNLLYSSKKSGNYDVYLNRFDRSWKPIDSTDAVTALGDLTSATFAYNPTDGLYWLAYVYKNVEGQNIYVKSLKLPSLKA